VPRTSLSTNSEAAGTNHLFIFCSAVRGVGVVHSATNNPTSACSSLAPLTSTLRVRPQGPTAPPDFVILTQKSRALYVNQLLWGSWWGQRYRRGEGEEQTHILSSLSSLFSLSLGTDKVDLSIDQLVIRKSRAIGRSVESIE
jgi:hypothetical protein